MMFQALTVRPAEVIQWRRVAVEPLSAVVLSTLKTWINRPLEDAFWDRESAVLVKVAQQAIERHCQMAIAPTTWLGTLSELQDAMRIMQRPFVSVDKIEYVDPVAGAVTTVPASVYQFGPMSQSMGWLQVGDGQDWPTAAVRQDAYRLTVKTGFYGLDPTKAELPDDILHALMMTVAALDSNRGDEGGGGGGGLSNTVWGQTHASGPSVIPSGAKALLAPYRLQHLCIA